MKNIIALVFLLFTSFAFSQIVNIPDANFKAKLLEADISNFVAKDLNGNFFKIDSNNDGEIEVSEALQVSYLDVEPNEFDQALQIADMQGIESFVNLIFLDCKYNSFTSLDTSNNVNLEVLKSRVCSNLSNLNLNNNMSLDSLDIAGSQINNLDLSANSNLKYIDVSNNSLVSLDISNNVNLEVLYCAGNQLTFLDFSNNNNIEIIDATLNQLTNLNLNNTTNLIDLNCSKNNLIALDVTDSINLINLSCSENEMTSLDLINNTNLQEISCYANQLNLLNVNNCSNLYYLVCSYNQLNSLDLSDNINLIHLTANDNLLTSLDLINNINLENLNVFNNQLTAITFGNSNLNSIDCNNNQINVLDVTTLSDLSVLRIANNYLTNIDLSNNSNLIDFNCSNNLLNSLDVSLNLNLDSVNCNNNQFSSLDFSNNPLLNAFSFSDNVNLNNVNIKNGNHFSIEFNPTNLPNLLFVCADEEEVVALQDLFIMNGVSANVNTYCSFTPGGDYNTITGTITFDSQNDGCDVNDDVFPFIKISINDGAETGATFTNNSGDYTFYTLAGNFLITPELENPTFFNVTPTQATIDFLTSDNGVATQDFCITSNGIHPDVEIVLAPTTPARPGFDAEYVLTYKNKGNLTLNGEFSFIYEDDVLDFLSSTDTPASQTTNVITWDYEDLLPFESRSVYITLNVNDPTETPPVNINDVLSFTTTINSIEGDELPLDNQFDFQQTVVGSYDPNNIICMEGDVVPTSEIGEYLHYIINFENTGTATAENIVVKTDVDPTQFDINSLRLLSSSHNAEVRIQDNKIEFIFEAIYLDTGGHGNILLKIQSQDNLQEDATVTENANIYFDYNYPIITNDANTTFQLLSITDFELDKSITIFPNPANNVLNISAIDIIKSVSLYDVQGRLLQSTTNNSNKMILELYTRASGIYFVKIISEKGTLVEKIIKQ